MLEAWGKWLLLEIRVIPTIPFSFMYVDIYTLVSIWPQAGEIRPKANTGRVVPNFPETWAQPRCLSAPSPTPVQDMCPHGFPNLETKPCLKISAEKQWMQNPLVPVKAFTPPAASLREDVPCGCRTPGCLRLQVEKTMEQIRKEISPFILPRVHLWTLSCPNFFGLWFCLFLCVCINPLKNHFHLGFLFSCHYASLILIYLVLGLSDRPPSVSEHIYII